jgi:hypothetical protein
LSRRSVWDMAAWEMVLDDPAAGAARTRPCRN